MRGKVKQEKLFEMFYAYMFIEKQAALSLKKVKNLALSYYFY